MAEIICRPFITLRNGKILYASAVGKQAFCFPADPEYWNRKKMKEAAQKATSNKT